MYGELRKPTAEESGIITERKLWQLRLNRQTKHFQGAFVTLKTGSARSVKHSTNQTQWGFTVAIYTQGVTELSDGVKITHRLYASAVISGLVGILLILVCGWLNF